jgi:hypothetical protein
MLTVQITIAIAITRMKRCSAPVPWPNPPWNPNQGWQWRRTMKYGKAAGQLQRESVKTVSCKARDYCANKGREWISSRLFPRKRQKHPIKERQTGDTIGSAPV